MICCAATSALVVVSGGSKLSGIDYEATGVACFGFLPNFGRSAGVVVSGRTAGKQFRQ